MTWSSVRNAILFYDPEDPLRAWSLNPDLANVRKFSDPSHEGLIISYLSELYVKSPLNAALLLEKGVNSSGNIRISEYEPPNVAGAASGGGGYVGYMALNLPNIDKIYYINNKGVFVKEIPALTIIHELGHLIDGKSDPSPVGFGVGNYDYTGDALKFQNRVAEDMYEVNNIQTSYRGSLMDYDLRYQNFILKASYTEFNIIDVAVIGDEDVISKQLILDRPDTVDHSSRTTPSRDLLFGLGGKDTLLSGAGVDYVYGGSGDDVIDGGEDSIVGGNGDDRLVGGGVQGLSPSMLFDGGDTLDGGAGDDTISGGDGADILYGRQGSDTLAGDGGNDTISGGGGSDTLNGGDGDDRLLVEGAAGVLRGEGGHDTLTSDWSGGTLEGGSGDDLLVIRGDYGLLIGGTGNDIIDITGGPGQSGQYNTPVYNTMVFRAGDGHDTYLGPGVRADGEEYRPIHWTDIRFEGLNRADVRILWVLGGTDVVVEVIATGDYIFISGSGYLGGSGAPGSAGHTVGLGPNFIFNDGTFTEIQGVLVASVEAYRPAGVNTPIDGTPGADTLSDKVGNDTIVAGAGDDLILASIHGGGGLNRINGGAGADTLSATADQQVIRFSSLESIEVVTADGHLGVVLAGSAENNLIDLSAMAVLGLERVTGGGGQDTIVGSADADRLAGGSDEDSISAGAGNDVIFSGYQSGADWVDGGSGQDSIVAADSWMAIELHSIIGIEVISSGGLANVSVAGSSGNDLLDFSLVTLVGIVEIDAGAGNDTIAGSAGSDTINGAVGNDLVEGGAGDDVLDGGEGIDTASYVGAASGVTVSLAIGTTQLTGGAGADTLLNIENLVGSVFGDGLTGTAGANTLDGGGGDDTLTGGAGADSLTGGAGVDTAAFSGTVADYTVAVGAGSVTVTHTVTGDVDTLTNIERLSFSDQSVTLGGGQTLTGTVGPDVLGGGATADLLNGGAGDDVLYGGAGADTL
jgi:Ca2+-binding RTX toxin-like protein